MSQVNERPKWFSEFPQSQQDVIVTRISELLDAETKIEQRVKEIANQFSLSLERAKEISSIISLELFNMRTLQSSSGESSGKKLKLKFKSAVVASDDGTIGEVLKAEQFATDHDKFLTAEGGPFHAYSLYQKVSDSSALAHKLRENNECYPIWVNPDLTIQLEYWEHPLPPNTKEGGQSPIAIPTSPNIVSEELLSIAEPKSRPDLIHSYALSTESMHGAAYGHNLSAKHIIGILEKYSKILPLPDSVVSFIEACSERFCRAKLLLVASKHFVVSNVPVLRHLLQNKAIQSCRHEDAFALRGEFESVESKEELEPRLLLNKENTLNSILVSSTSTSAQVKPSSPILRIENKDKEEQLKEKEESKEEGKEDTMEEEVEVQNECVEDWISKPNHMFAHAQKSDFEESLMPLKFKTINNIVHDMHGKRKENSLFLHFLNDLEIETCIDLLKYLIQEIKMKKISKRDNLDESSNNNNLINYKLKQDVLLNIEETSPLEDSNAMVDATPSKSWYCDNIELCPVSILKVVSKYGLSSSQVDKAMHWLFITLKKYLSENLVTVQSEPTRGIKLKLGKKVKQEDKEDDKEEGDGKRVKLSHRFQIREGRGQVESVRHQAWEEGFPLLEEYDFNRDSRNKVIFALSKSRDAQQMPYALKPDKRLRDYQEKALYSMFGAHNKARSGIVVLPCGAGKTLVGISAAQRIGRSCVVLCNNNAAAEQWKRAFLEFTDIPEKKLFMFHAKSKPENLPDPCILITTYTILGDRKPAGGVESLGDASLATKQVLRAICGSEDAPREWALMVLDEVHMSPAKMFRTVMDKCKAQCKLGLTATLVREDEKIGELSYLIGPKLHEANWTELAAQNHLATVKCYEVWCDMNANHMREVLTRAGRSHAWENGGQKLISIMNPNKYRAAEFLLRKHEELGDKVLLFSDNIYSLKMYCEKLNIPKLHGETNFDEREALLGCFRGQDEHVFKNFVRTIRRKRGLGSHKWRDVVNGVDFSDEVNKKLFKEFQALSPLGKRKFQFPALGLSSVGDVAIDLPDANVILQVSGQGGGRRQEAQRMGRILRKKSNGMDNNAKFYSLLSRDTKEMVTGAKRQEYLIDQGYQYKVLLADQEMYGDWTSPTVPCNSIAERNLLEGVLEAINEGEATSDGYKTRGSGSGTSKKVGKKGKKAPSVVSSKYSQPGRFALLKWKKKAAKDRPPTY